MVTPPIIQISNNGVYQAKVSLEIELRSVKESDSESRGMLFEAQRNVNALKESAVAAQRMQEQTVSICCFVFLLSERFDFSNAWMHREHKCKSQMLFSFVVYVCKSPAVRNCFEGF